MNNNKLLGIIFIILGIIFIAYPVFSAGAVSLIAGISLIALGIAAIADGFSLWSQIMHVSAIKILLGILAIIMGFLFLYTIDALSFIVGFQFYIIALIMIFIGIFGLFEGTTTEKLMSLFIIIMGCIAFYLAFFSIAQPLYAAILVGISLICEGISFMIE